MADIFMFSAQPELENNEGATKKPPDPMASAKRARAFDENEEAKASNKDRGSAIGTSEPYGPWMHVSYGRFGRNSWNSNQAGKKNGVLGKNSSGFKYASSSTTSGAERYGNVDNGSTSISDLPTTGAESIGHAMGNIRDSGRLMDSLVKK
ncbi:hypothetical protein Q3G72_027693 [Acer saccharum]|nr:hypothetical protein Q3G72_027693 [Acer saccharum]